ncbi:MAG TPA: M1 family metallopeptidase [Salinimicrobium sp.]|nr:M1 family metallopeptidase [Salinimicrobium sp.]
MKQIFYLIFLLLPGLSCTAQQTDFIDFKNVNAEISIFPHQKSVEGAVTYKFSLLRAVDSVFIDAKNMEFSNVELNGKKIKHRVTTDKLWLFLNSKNPGNYILNLDYKASPKQAMYFVGWDYMDKVNPQVWTQGQGRYTSHWLPSFDDYREKAIFNLTIDFPKDYTVISNGVLKKRLVINDSLNRWFFDMKKPMSSYLVAIAAGKYQYQEIKAKSGISVYNFYEPDAANKVEPTYRHTKEIFDFLEKEIEVPYPWQNYKQVPVQDFIFAGMENTGLTIFSDLYMIDSIGFVDRNYVMVNAHELAHQWFGDMVTAKNDSHHWLQEGFATYYALLAEREIFGEDYYYWKLYESATRLKNRSDLGEGEAVLSDKSNSLTYYQKGSWVLHMLREKIGDEAFKSAVQNYLNKYAYKNATTENFLNEVEQSSQMNINGFVEEWLEGTSFPEEAAFSSLKKSKFMREYLELSTLRELPLEEKFQELNNALDDSANFYIGQEVVSQLSVLNSEKALFLYKKALKTNNTLIRQAVAMGLKKIPFELKQEYETLLQDKSYVTQEATLFNLWRNFPENRITYLNDTKNLVGFNDKNLRTLWLTLHLATPDYSPNEKSSIFEELTEYSAPYHPHQLRVNAFSYLFELNQFDQKSLKNLIEACVHQVSRFQMFARQIFDELMQREGYPEKFVVLMDELPPKQREFLKQKLK